MAAAAASAEDDSLLNCTRPGCGAAFLASERGRENACSFHHGQPVFWEGRKGWSCCKRRVDTFEEFVEIPGCALGAHSDAPPDGDDDVAQKWAAAKAEAEAEKAAAAAGEGGAGGAGRRREVAAPKHNPPPSKNPALKGGFTQPGKDGELIGGTAGEAQRAAAQAAAEAAAAENDAPDAVIPAGAVCVRTGCKAVYAEGMARSDDECSHHPGVAVFHEGSKGWSCCKPRVLNFDQFLELATCTKGRHRFLPPAGPGGAGGAGAAGAAAGGGSTVDCRADFFQSGARVTVTVYAKRVDKDASTVEIAENTLKVDLKFRNGDVHRRTFQLAGPVVPAESTFEIMGTKVECVLLRAPGSVPWESLEKE